MGELISIIVPAYNCSPYLDNCLTSILQQSYPNIEIILVDDGSTDNTLEIAERYYRKYPDKIRLLHTENQGVTKARFEGIKIATGNWVGFVDADDETEPDMYERLYYNAKKYDADISHCGYKTIVNGGERIHEFYNTGRLLEQNTQSGLRGLLDGPIEPGLWNKLYHMSLLQELLQDEVMDTTIKFSEDLLMNYYLFSRANRAIYEDFCGYHYLAHGSTATRSAVRIERILDPVKVWRIILDSADKDMGDIAWRKYLLACINAYAYLSGTKSISNEPDAMREEFYNNRDKWHLLKRRERLKLKILLLSPAGYNHMYRFYKKHFQKRIYE